MQLVISKQNIVTDNNKHHASMLKGMKVRNFMIAKHNIVNLIKIKKPYTVIVSY